jgi:DNA-binding Lrp family transcriptional regulator
MKPQLDRVDQALLTEVQARFPVEHRPFALLGQKLGLTEEQCLDRVTGLKSRRIIRQLSAIFHAASLGHRVLSVALEVEPARADALAALLGRYPGVSYADRKDDPFSVWLTMAVPSDALDRTASTLSSLTRAKQALALPVVKLAQGGELGEAERRERAEEAAVSGSSALKTLTPRDLELIRLVQQDLPVLEMPFAVWAEQANAPEEELFGWMQRMQRLGCLSRVGAMVVERDESQPFGETVLWRVPAEIDATGERLARSRYVSHCSRRPAHDDWPYPLLTHMHPTTRQELTGRVAEQAGGIAYRRLVKIKEYQLRPVKLFAPDLAAWWHETVKPGSAAPVAS